MRWPESLGRALLAAALLGGAATAAPGTTATTVSGVVRLSLDGLPVPGATVRFVATDGSGAWSAATDSAGRYVLALPPRTAVVEAQAPVEALRLGAAYPNPFNSATMVPLEVDEVRRLRLTVFGILGQPVRTLLDAELAPGRYTIPWDGRDEAGRPVAAGVYLLRLAAAGRVLRGKVALADGTGGERGSAAPSPRPTGCHAGAAAFDVQVAGEALETLVVRGLRPEGPIWEASFEVAAGTREAAGPTGRRTALRGVPGGPFTMGSGRYGDEAPARTVWLPPYYLQELEVTVAEYADCVAAGACQPPAIGGPCNWGQEGRGDHPINCVSARDAERYCRWAGLRLPTEAEWEKAARGSGGRTYPWGNKPPGGAGDCERAVMMRAGLGLGCGNNGTGPVGTCRRGSSPYGVEDLAGNVWEWTADTYERDFYGRAPAVDPVNGASGPYRVLRGNAWYYCDPDADLRAANRYRLQPLRWNPFTGLRCASSRGRPAPGEGPPVTAEEEGALQASRWMERNERARQARGKVLPPGPALADQDMVRVAAGAFEMGSAATESDEVPVRTVYLDAYYIDRYEVTVEAYDACVVAGSCRAPHSDGSVYTLAFEAHYLNGGRAERPAHPVNGVSWHDAAAYCAWAGKRLPTEAEWEKAARGTDGRPYPWGEAEPDCGRTVMDDGGDGCGYEMAWPVGSKPAGNSPYGVCDLAGNLWEWVDDWYEHGYYRRAPDRNPRNTDVGTGHKVLRGGSMADQNPHIHRATNRLAYDPAQRYDYTIGFRCARDADE